MTATRARQKASPLARHRWAVAALTAAALALRLTRLGVDSLWYDETVSVYLAGQPLPDLIAHTARDIHPPGYYALLRAWLAAAGFPTGHADPAGYRLEFMAAFLSLWFGVLLVPLTWQLARRLRLGDRTATVAALLVAVSPFGVWYSQEVRMYTLGAALGVVCLLATAPFLLGDAPAGRLWRSAVVYALAAAAGLYALYYFAFLLISLNLLLLPLTLWRARAPGPSRRALAAWLAAQIGALLFFAPWLPVAWRQATDPPVPPWRSAPQLLATLGESWGALSFGQSADIARFWPLLLLTLGLAALGVAAAWRGQTTNAAPSTAAGENAVAPRSGFLPALLLLAAAFGPLALILLASAVTPLYHVRYLFTYAPAFSILLAMGIVALANWRPSTRPHPLPVPSSSSGSSSSPGSPPIGPLLAVAALLLLLTGAALSLRAFWTDPQLRADDHRAAVRELAARWRPGDAILVNAGYAYPALLTYWPGAALVQTLRLGDYQSADAQRAASLLWLVQTGHVDGAADLGWGDPQSDFYALSADATRQKLNELAQTHDRLWHYRIYDTVNDPQGLIRQTLGATATLMDDRVYSGEANLRVQLWQAGELAKDAAAPVATFDGWLTLALPPDAAPTHSTGGDSLDVRGARWLRAPAGAGREVALSLRLVDASGEVWAAHDEPLGGNQPATGELVQPLRVQIPPALAAGDYRLELVVYDPLTGQPLPLPDGQTSLALGAVAISPSTTKSALPALADFGPLRLLEADSAASVVSPGDEIPVELLWQAGAGASTEPLVTVVQLVDASGNVIASLEEEPLQGHHPTTNWLDNELVRDRHRLSVPADAPPGLHRLIVGVYRAGDRQRLPASAGPLGIGSSDHATIGEIEVR